MIKRSVRPSMPFSPMKDIHAVCSAAGRMFSRLALWDGTAAVSIAKPLGIVWVNESNGAKSPTAPFLVWAPLHHIYIFFSFFSIEW